MFFEPTTTRIADAFFETTVKKYVARARFWGLVGCACLVLTLVFVGVCLWIFRSGDPQEKLRAENEAKLTAELLDLRRQERESGLRDAERSAKLEFLGTASLLANRLGQLPATAEGLRSEKDATQVKKVRMYLTMTERVLKSMSLVNPKDENSQPELVLDLSAWGEDKSSRFPPQSLAIIREEIRLNAGDIDKLKSEVSKLAELLDALEKANFVPDSAAAKEVENFLIQMPEIRRLKAVSTKIKQQQSGVAQEVRKLAEDAPAREQVRQHVQKNIEQVELELKEIRAERDKILFMAWIPNLTIRVGAVLLLLFLTQVFVATYRYTIGLSAFYLARADTVAMLQSTPEANDRYNVDDFGSLAEKLSPALSIDDVKAPTDHFADIAKAWVAKMPAR